MLPFAVRQKQLDAISLSVESFALPKRMVFGVTNTWLTFTSNKQIKVDIWWVGLSYYLLALGLGSYYMNTIFDEGTYLTKAHIKGYANPYAIAANISSVQQADNSYCSNPNYDYYV